MHLVHVTQLLGLHIYAGSFETSQRGEMVCHFSEGRYLLGSGSAWWGVGRLSTGQEYRMSQCSIVYDLSSAF
jgi:hypothetical protein